MSVELPRYENDPTFGFEFAFEFELGFAFEMDEEIAKDERKRSIFVATQMIFHVVDSVDVIFSLSFDSSLALKTCR